MRRMVPRQRSRNRHENQTIGNASHNLCQSAESVRVYQEGRHSIPGLPFMNQRISVDIDSVRKAAPHPGGYLTEADHRHQGRLRLSAFPKRRHGRADGRHRCAAARHGAGDRLWRDPGKGAGHGCHRRLPDFGAGRQPLPDRRATGAFVVVVFNVIAAHGYDGLVLAALMAGAMLIVAGLRSSVAPSTVALAAAALATIIGLRRFAPRLPGASS